MGKVVNPNSPWRQGGRLSLIRQIIRLEEEAKLAHLGLFKCKGYQVAEKLDKIEELKARLNQ